MSKTHTALVIDDESDIRELIAMTLDRIGLDTHTAANLEEAEHLLSTYSFDVCLTDMRLPDGNGVDFVNRIHELQPELPVAVITAHGNMQAAVEAMKNGAFDFVSKPVDIKLLRQLVMQAIKAGVGDSAKLQDNASNMGAPALSFSTTHSMLQENVDSSSISRSATTQPDASNEHANPNIVSSLNELSGRRISQEIKAPLIGGDRLIGRSDPMKLLRSMIQKVARTNAPVWVTGESGTGKELIAHLIHDNSPRANAQFVAVNCGAIPSELMESEMFGHRKGSFTGAHSDHDGLFQRADGGTLFLDEVAELPLHMQVKLLRAIQERSIRPVGSSNEIVTDVRIVSASHKDLAQEVSEGRFRHDLYYRLNVICIKSPSLRERCTDVLDIAKFILKAIASKEGFPKSVNLTPEAEALLLSYSYPGNVRELENILERAVAMADDDSISANDLDISDDRLTTVNPLEGPDINRAVMHSNERESIIQVLNSTLWNRKAAAQQLGMTYRQLRYRIQQYGIDQNKTGT